MLHSCSSPKETSSQYTWHTIPHRDTGDLIRTETYRIKVPKNWSILLPYSEESIIDTKKPNATLILGENNTAIVITIHTFPSLTLQDRIPPGAQVARWKSQFTKIDPSSIFTAIETRGGFCGIFFEASGILPKQDDEMSVIAWSMQLDAAHYHALESLHPEMQADYTLKIVGPRHQVEKYRKELIGIAHSFELIEEIPQELF